MEVGEERSGAVLASVPERLALSPGRSWAFPKPPPSHEGGEGSVSPASAPRRSQAGVQESFLMRIFGRCAFQTALLNSPQVAVDMSDSQTLHGFTSNACCATGAPLIM